jgi:hypothetical protein
MPANQIRPNPTNNTVRLNTNANSTINATNSTRGFHNSPTIRTTQMNSQSDNQNRSSRQTNNNNNNDDDDGEKCCFCSVPAPLMTVRYLNNFKKKQSLNNV